MKTLNAPYVRAVDHVRAFAALLVVFYHAIQHIGGRLEYGQPELLRPEAATPFDALLFEGHTGVALFMVLSGFIFTNICLGQRLHYGSFVLNRVLRIYPLMLFMFGLAWLVSPSEASLADLAGLLLIPFSLSHPVDLWFVPAIHPFTTLFWAIAVEFKFYLIFPVLLGLLHRDGLKSIAVILGGAMMLRVLLVLDGGDAQAISYWTIFGRIDQFLLGMTAAVAYRSNSRRLDALAPAALGLAWLMLFALSRVKGFAPEIWWVLWPTIEGAVWAAFIIGYLHWSERLSEHISSVLAYVGKISFSVYLLHLTVISGLLQLGPISFGLGSAGSAGLITLVFVVPLTVAVSAITYHLIEEPFLRLRVRYLKGAGERVSSGTRRAVPAKTRAPLEVR